MKRTPLNRYTEIKRKKRIKPMSAKKKQEIDDTSAMRAAYVAEQGLCDECQRKTATDNHEIASGNCRSAAVYVPNTWLALCRECHDRLQGGPIEPQIATKFRAVLRDINACRDGRKQFTMSDVFRHMRSELSV